MSKYKPTDAEMEILLILWDKGASSVRDINDILNQKRDVGYTTTLKLMQIMYEKGLAKRDAGARTHIYTAGVRESETKNHMISDFVNVAFRGSAMSLVMQALGNSETSRQELDELKDLIAKLEQNS